MSARFLEIFIEIFAYAIIALPLVHSKGLFFGSVFSQAILFELLVEVCVVFFLVHVVRNGTRVRVARKPLVVSLGIFIATLFFTSFTGVDLMRSLWSTGDRMTGVVFMVHVGAWAALLASVVREERVWQRFFFWSLGVSWLVGYKVYMTGSPEPFREVLGSVNFLAVYALAQFFIALALFAKTQRKQVARRCFIVLSMILEFILLAGTGERAAFFSLLVTLLCIGGTGIFFLHKHQKKRECIFFIRGAAVFALVVGMMVTAFYAPYSRDWVKAHAPHAVVRVFYNTFDRLGERGALWNYGLQGFLERPLFGWGFGNFQYIHQQYYRHSSIMDGDGLADRPHNQPIEMLDSMGIIGFAAYGILWFLIARTIYRVIKKTKSVRRHFELAAIGGFFFSYFLQNLFFFDTVIGLIFFAFFFGYSASLDEETPKSIGRVLFHAPAVRAGMYLLITLAGGYAAWNAIAVPLYQNRGFTKALREAHSNPEQSLGDMREAMSGQPSFMRITLRWYLALYIDSLNQVPAKKDVMRAALYLAVAEQEDSIRRLPSDIKSYIMAAVFYQGLYQLEGSPALLGRAREHLLEALQLSPNYERVYEQLAEIYILEGNYEEARATAEQIFRFSPDNYLTRLLMDKINALIVNTKNSY